MAPFQARFLPILFTLVTALGFVARPGAALQANPRAGNAPSTVTLVDIAAQSNDTASNGRDPAIAVDPTNPSRIVVLSRTPSVNRKFPLWVSGDGGQNRVQHYSVPWPSGTILGATENIDFGQDGVLYGTFGTLNDAYTGTTTDPTQPGAWSWNVTPTGTQVTNLATPFQEETRLLVGYNPLNPTQSRAYVAYHGTAPSEPGIKVSVSDTTEPPRFLTDNMAVPATVGPTGLAVPSGNPLVAQDPANGSVYVFFQETRPRANGGM